MIKRIVSLPDMSFFLFGPRQTGKSTLIQSRFTEHVWRVDLLLSDIFLNYSKDPSMFRREAEEKIANEKIKIIFVDEIQRLPALLDEIHYLMEKYPKCQFILTGSSARKLKRSGANLLGGRAMERYLFPLCYKEIKDKFNLEDALCYGTLPAVFVKPKEVRRDILLAYTNVYLREEIQQEGIVRNLGGFSRFLDMAAAQFSEQVSFSGIARECALPVKTVQAYYDILSDTLIGFYLEPWYRSLRKRLSMHKKFYFFDNGVTNAVNRQLSLPLDASLRGRLFEQFIVVETYRKLRYAQSDASIYFWRTGHGAEVDIVIEKHKKILAAIEIKATARPSSAHLSGLKAFREEYPDVPPYMVCCVRNGSTIDGVKILPWEKYLVLLDGFV